MTSPDLRQQVAVGQLESVRSALRTAEQARSFDNIDGGLSSAQLSVLVGDLIDERLDNSVAVLVPTAEGMDLAVDLLLSSLPSDPRLQLLADAAELESSVTSAALLVVPLDSRATNTDLTVNTVLQAVASSQRAHVSMYTALGSVPEPQARFGVDRETLHREMLALRGPAPAPSHNDTTYNPYCSGDTCTTRFPPAFWEGFIVSVILLIILFVGACCTCYVQTPDKFATPAKNASSDDFLD
jgi:V0 complex accessory subunit Ac45/VOA1 transmembrane domain